MMFKGTILKDNVKELEKKVNKINKKVKKFKIEPLKLKILDEFTEPIEDSINGFVLKVRKMVNVEIEGEEPKINGWELISIFQLEKNDIILTRTVPGKELPKELYPTKIKCNHCNTKHFRTKSFLLHNIENEKYKEIGSSCIKDFCGHNPEGWISLLSIENEIHGLENDENSGGYGSYNSDAYDLIHFLIITSAIVRNHGWVSKTKALKSGELDPYYTSRNVENQINNRNIIFDIEIIEEDKKFAKETIEYFKNIDDDSEYVINIQKLIELDYVPHFQAGLAASMVGTYINHNKKKEENKKPSEWVGKIKERITIENVKVIHKTGFETQWGWTNIYTFLDENGNIYKWFTGSNIIEFDKPFELVGTVKKHDEYREQKQTILTRCKIKE